MINYVCRDGGDLKDIEVLSHRVIFKQGKELGTLKKCYQTGSLCDC